MKVRKQLFFTIQSIENIAEFVFQLLLCFINEKIKLLLQISSQQQVTDCTEHGTVGSLKKGLRLPGRPALSTSVGRVQLLLKVMVLLRIVGVGGC